MPEWILRPASSAILRQYQPRERERKILEVMGEPAIAAMIDGSFSVSLWLGRDLMVVYGVMREWPGRGQFWMLFDQRLEAHTGIYLTGAVRIGRASFEDIVETLGIRELRAWVPDGDDRAQRFAEWFGFHYDCGPALGFGPDGADYNLFRWSKDDGWHGSGAIQGTEKGQG